MLLHTCRCGKLIPQGVKRCDQCAAGSSQGITSRHMEYNMYRRNKRTAKFYTSAEWRGLRQRIMSVYDGIDIYAYYVQHRVMTADMVHHIVEVEDDWNMRLDGTNLIPLSNSNHGIISALYAKNEASKRDTQKLLRELISRHWEEVGAVPEVLNGAV